MVEGGFEVEAGVGAGGGGRGGVGEVVVEGCVGEALLASEVGGLAEEDGVEPGLDGGAFLEGVEAAEGGDEGFLEEVFGIVVGGDLHAGEAEESGRVAVDEGVECLGLSGLSLAKEVEVGLVHHGS